MKVVEETLINSNNNTAIDSSVFTTFRNDGWTIAKTYYEIRKKKIISFDDYLWMSQFFGDYKLLEKDNVSWNNQMQDLLTFLGKNNIGYLDEEAFEKLISDKQFRGTFMNMFELAFAYVRQYQMNDIVREGLRTYRRPNYLPFKYYSDDFYLQWASGDPTSDTEAGEVAVIIGEKGGGKSDMAMLLSEIALRNNSILLTNINLNLPNVQTFSTFSEMLRNILINSSAEKRTFVVLDEAKVSGMRKKRAMAGETLNLEELLALTRKFGTSMIMIWHYDFEITTEVLQSASMIIHKYGSVIRPDLRDEAMFEFKGDTNQYYIKRIPRTTLPYNTKDPALFSMDIKLRDIIGMSTKLEKEGEQGRDFYVILIDYLNNLVNENATKLPEDTYHKQMVENESDIYGTSDKYATDDQ